MINKADIRRMFERGKVVSEDAPIMNNICEMVFKNHFNYRFDIFDDLIQEGVLGIIRLVDEGNYSESAGDILTFVYSRVRNCMTNYLYHENKSNSPCWDVTEFNIGKEDTIFGGVPGISEELVQEISGFVDSKITELNLSGDMKDMVRAYFNDKLGIKYPIPVPREFSLDFVEKYRYYVSLLEYEMFVKYINKKLFDNKIRDIVDVLESEGDVGFYMKMFLDSLTDDQLVKLMYVFSSNTFVFPSKYKMLKVDNYLSIYKRLKYGNNSAESVAKQFDKPLPTVLSILQKFEIIFS